MGGNGSTTRKVSFGLDEEENVTIIQGVKLSEEVLQRMRESQGSSPPPAPQTKQPPSPPPPSPTPKGPTPAEIQEEMRRKFEQEQALVQEQLARLAQKEKERDAVSATTTQGLDVLTPALIIEKGKTHEELEKAKLLPADLDAWARQLERKDRELATISAFYKEQLETLEKKNLENYQQTAEQYNEAATKAEAHIRPRHTETVCTELQARVLQCYRDNPQQSLLCSGLAKQYMSCIQQAKTSMLNSRG